MANELKNAMSPLLLQRSDDPVHWHVWGADAFAEAQRLNKPIHLSIGYSACHSCHTMGRESFADPVTAEVMNELFVNIQVDRDERPDIDEVYQVCAKQLGNTGGGWPLTMFLTPSGEAFGGGTYFPKYEQADKPTFVSVLKDASKMFNEMPDAIVKNTSILREQLDRSFSKWAPRPAGEELRAEVFDYVTSQVCTRFDTFHGGLIGSPKFPAPALVEQLWRGFCRTFLPQYERAVDTTLRSICEGGIYDHLGGGIFRYATDEHWLHPRFEKMLYDSAQLIDILGLVWQRNQQPLFRRRIEETVGWLLREMLADGGGFAASLDSESGGEEGRYYLWTQSEIEAVLGNDAKQFCESYGVQPAGNWEGSNVLHRRNAPALTPVMEGQFNAMRQRLLGARTMRAKPARDDTVLTAWNGMTIAALAKAAELFNRADWRAAAVKAFWFVSDATGQEDGLVREQRDGRLGGAAFAEDYAHMARAAIALYETTGHAPYLERAQRWVDRLDADFFSRELHGYCLTAAAADSLIVRPRTVFDSVIPSANAVMIDVLSRLSFLTWKPEYRERAQDLVRTFAEDALSVPLGAASFFDAFDTFVRGTQIVIVGPANAPRVLAFHDALRRVSLPEKIVTTVAQVDQLPESHPLRSTGYADKQPAVFVCRGGVVSRPVIDPVAFELLLKTRTVPAAPATA